MSITNTPVSSLDPNLLDGVLSGDFRAIARLITFVENGAPESEGYLRALFPHTGRCTTLGITGAPGSGKSTLVDGLASAFRARGGKVGIIAVDPTSPFTGGAILGDRVRMQSRSVDPGTFIRSMATRGHLGGLSRTTPDVLTVLDASGFERVLIETVGVGQDEVEVVRTADVTLVVLVPGMGDDIQAMKAGIMEIGDVFVLNKADRPGADRLELEVKSLISFSKRRDDWRPPIVRTIAVDGEGISECIASVEEYLAFSRSSPFQRQRRLEIQKQRLLHLLHWGVLQKLLNDSESVALIDRLALQVVDRKMDPFSAAEELMTFAFSC